jgi:hypothetical protein
MPRKYLRRWQVVEGELLALIEYLRQQPFHGLAQDPLLFLPLDAHAGRQGGGELGQMVMAWPEWKPTYLMKGYRW